MEHARLSQASDSLEKLSGFDPEFLCNVCFEVAHPCVLANHVGAVFVLKRWQRMKLCAVVTIFVVNDVLRDEVLEEVLLQVQLVVVVLNKLGASVSLQDVEIGSGVAVLDCQLANLLLALQSKFEQDTFVKVGVKAEECFPDLILLSGVHSPWCTVLERVQGTLLQFSEVFSLNNLLGCHY